MASLAAILAIGNPVAFDASADDRETDDHQDQGVFGRRSARIVASEVLDEVHFRIPLYALPGQAGHGVTKIGFRPLFPVDPRSWGIFRNRCDLRLCYPGKHR